MIPSSFDYHKAGSVSEAISLLQQYGDDAKILAGGHSLIPMMKLRLASPVHLIDINSVNGLEYIKEEGNYLKIGAMTREVSLEHSDVVKSKYPIIFEATKMIADPQVRNRATVGGNLAHGDPANDHPAVMLALNAEVAIQGPSGERTVKIDDFFQGFFSTAIGSNEILTEIRVPTPPGKSGGSYLKLERKVGDFATAGVAVQVTLDGDNCRSIGIGLTNVNSTPMRAKRSEDFLRGKPLNEQNIAEAAKMAAEDCDPAPDLRGDEEYKRAMVKTLTMRALKDAAEKARRG